MENFTKKRLLLLTGIVAFLAAAVLVSCKTEADDEPKTPEYTVTFVTNGGGAMDSQTITKDGKVTKPQDPVVALTEGLYKGSAVSEIKQVEGWYRGMTKWDFDTDTVTENITLTVKYVEPESVSLESASGANIVTKAVEVIKNTPGSYTLFLNSDVDVDTTQVFDVTGVELTLIGLGQERKINLTVGGTGGKLFSVGKNGVTGAGLTLGNNITLVGRTKDQNGAAEHNNSPVVYVEYGAKFTMLEGSKITGNTNSKTGNFDGLGSAVHLFNASSGNEAAGAIFTMKGGLITGNASGRPETGGNSGRNVGGVCVEGKGSKLIMEGGNISGNTAPFGDIFIFNTATAILSGDAEIGAIELHGVSGSSFASIIISSGWTGSSTVTLNLFSGFSADTSLSNYVDKNVLSAAEGYTLTAADVARFALGKAVPTSPNGTTTVPEDIDGATHKIDETGKLVTITP